MPGAVRLATADEQQDPFAIPQVLDGARSVYLPSLEINLKGARPIPGQYFIVGGTDPAAFDAAAAGVPPIPSHHSPLFKIMPEPAIKMGIEAMTVAVFRLLEP